MGLVIVRNLKAFNAFIDFESLCPQSKSYTNGSYNQRDDERWYAGRPSFLDTLVRNNTTITPTIVELRQKYPGLTSFIACCLAPMPNDALASACFLVLNNVWMPHPTAVLRCQVCAQAFVEHPYTRCLYEPTFFEPPPIPFYTWNQRRGFRMCHGLERRASRVLYELSSRFSRARETP